MSRSLYRRLHRRFGQRLTGTARVLQLEAHRQQLAQFLPLNILSPAGFSTLERPLRVAVIGGGFAGIAAAAALQNLHVQVALFEARPGLGGRVDSTSRLIPNRILERGAELIGRNHPIWIDFARQLGLGLSVITDDDEYAGAQLAPRIRLAGRLLRTDEVEVLYRHMRRALEELTRLAAMTFVSTSPLEPWKAPRAAELDNRSVASWIAAEVSDPLTRAALTLEFANDMAVPTDRQSLLAILTQIAGGGLKLYWSETEVYRCEDGNVRLATKLAERLVRPPRSLGLPAGTISHEAVTQITVGDRHVEVGSTTPAGGARRLSRYDYAILAVPPTVWSAISIRGARLPAPIQSGPAVKFLAWTESRFWIRPGYAPSGVDDRLGQLWEGTDNQAGANNIDLTLFAGGPYADRIGRTPASVYFPRGMETLLPGFLKDFTGKYTYADWPNERYIRTGYCCPAPRQVTGVLRDMQGPIGARLFLAGEHISPPFFGFMEGALQSGVMAARRVAQAAGIRIPVRPAPAPTPAPGPTSPPAGVTRVA